MREENDWWGRAPIWMWALLSFAVALGGFALISDRLPQQAAEEAAAEKVAAERAAAERAAAERAAAERAAAERAAAEKAAAEKHAAEKDAAERAAAEKAAAAKTAPVIIPEPEFKVDERQARVDRLLPQFPWPPPRASASYVLPAKLFDRYPTMGSVAGAIISVLEIKGYVERSFFSTKEGGVVLVTRLERINNDGSSFAEPKRWATATAPNETQKLYEFLRGLFFVDPGRYRIIAFILQEGPFAQSPQQVTEQEARAWLNTGANVLPPKVAERPFDRGSCTVLIYEFTSIGNRRTRLVDSPLTGRDHLTKAGVLTLLGKDN